MGIASEIKNQHQPIKQIQRPQSYLNLATQPQILQELRGTYQWKRLDRASRRLHVIIQLDNVFFVIFFR